MSDPDMIATEFVVLSFEFEIPDFSDCFDHLDMFLMIEHADACTIVATIFETLESSENFTSGMP
jgi:hypothetical protein